MVDVPFKVKISDNICDDGRMKMKVCVTVCKGLCPLNMKQDIRYLLLKTQLKFKLFQSEPAPQPMFHLIEL